jgi:hypothetical protein
MDDREITLDIKYEETFKPTESTPAKVVLNKEKFQELSKKYGVYGIDWYFVDSDTIKFFDGEKWDYEKVFPDKVITQREIEKLEKSI